MSSGESCSWWSIRHEQSGGPYDFANDSDRRHGGDRFSTATAENYNQLSYAKRRLLAVVYRERGRLLPEVWARRESRVCKPSGGGCHGYQRRGADDELFAGIGDAGERSRFVSRYGWQFPEQGGICAGRPQRVEQRKRIEGEAHRGKSDRRSALQLWHCASTKIRIELASRAMGPDRQ